MFHVLLIELRAELRLIAGRDAGNSDYT